MRQVLPRSHSIQELDPTTRADAQGTEALPVVRSTVRTQRRSPRPSRPAIAHHVSDGRRQNDAETRPIPRDARFLTESDGWLGAGRIRKLIKRAMDVVGAFLMLTILAPVMVIVAVLVTSTSRGPAIFRQERVGLDGQRFQIFKFRTMKEGADTEKEELEHLNEVDGPVFKIKKDPRVTWVGDHLRRWSLDELPQLVNVLKGDMSLVGPRPPLPSEVETYNVWERQRLKAPPGLTCLWQVSGRSEVDFETWVKMDLEYIANWRPALDIELLAKTLPAVVKRDGAY